MILHPPFFISSRLLPAIKIGDAVLSLQGVEEGNLRKTRDRATFILDFPPDGSGHPIAPYVDDDVQSGMQGFKSTVAIFETFLSFLSACAASYNYPTPGAKQGENATLFPEHVAEWAADNVNEIDCARCDLCDPEDGCTVLEHLIEE